MSAFLGESYDYWKSIKQPKAMGMSPGFSLSALATNVDGLLSYVEVLISGTGNASVTGKPLGNKFFLKTMGKCSETTAEKWKKERDEDEAWDKQYEEVEVQEDAQKITYDQATKLKNALNEEKKKREEKRSGEKKRWRGIFMSITYLMGRFHLFQTVQTERQWMTSAVLFLVHSAI